MKELNGDLLKMVESGSKQNKNGVLGILKKLRKCEVDSELLKESAIGKTLTQLSTLKEGHFACEEGLEGEKKQEV